MHTLRTHVDHVVVAAPFHRAVQGEVLDAGHHAVRGAQALTLIGAHQRAGDLRYQVGIFAEAFGGPAPARITGDVDHRCKCQVQAVGAGLDGRHATAKGDGLEIPARRQRQADREDGAVAVNDVVGEKDRNAQATAQRRILHGAVVGAGDRIEGGANASGSDLLDDPLARHVTTDADQPQLADLLHQGHALEQGFDQRLPVIQRQRGLCRTGERAHRAGKQDKRQQPFHHHVPQPHSLEPISHTQAHPSRRL